MLSKPTVILVVSVRTIRRAERQITACESCEPTVDTPFSRILARVTQSQEDLAEHFLSEPAHCPSCSAEVFEGTLVEPA